MKFEFISHFVVLNALVGPHRSVEPVRSRTGKVTGSSCLTDRLCYQTGLNR